jgi:hypothetical protein
MSKERLEVRLPLVANGNPTPHITMGIVSAVVGASTLHAEPCSVLLRSCHTVPLTRAGFKTSLI